MVGGLGWIILEWECLLDDRFDLPATEMTPEVKKDLQVLQMRNYIFKDKFYKKSDPLPKYFQVVCGLDW